MLVFPGAGYAVLPFFWIPKDTVDLLEEKGDPTYAMWVRQGYLKATEGNVTDYDVIRTDIGALAERFVDGRLSDEALSRMTDDEIEAALTEVSGIGPWTAHGFLIFALDRPDVLLSGDLALRHSVQGLYGLDHIPTEREMVEVAERWRPYRNLAVSYLFASEFEERT